MHTDLVPALPYRKRKVAHGSRFSPLLLIFPTLLLREESLAASVQHPALVGFYQPGLFATCWYDYIAIIVGEIITKVYPVRMSPTVSRRAILADLETRLDRWYIGLSDNLSYDVASRRAIPPPHVLFLHIRYWGAVLLLNRALWVLPLLGLFIMLMSVSIPNWKGYKWH